MSPRSSARGNAGAAGRSAEAVASRTGASASRDPASRRAGAEPPHAAAGRRAAAAPGAASSLRFPRRSRLRRQSRRSPPRRRSCSLRFRRRRSPPEPPPPPAPVELAPPPPPPKPAEAPAAQAASAPARSKRRSPGQDRRARPAAERRPAQAQSRPEAQASRGAPSSGAPASASASAASLSAYRGEVSAVDPQPPVLSADGRARQGRERRGRRRLHHRPVGRGRLVRDHPFLGRPRSRRGGALAGSMGRISPRLPAARSSGSRRASTMPPARPIALKSAGAWLGRRRRRAAMELQLPRLPPRVGGRRAGEAAHPGEPRRQRRRGELGPAQRLDRSAPADSGDAGAAAERGGAPFADRRRAADQHRGRSRRRAFWRCASASRSSFFGARATLDAIGANRMFDVVGRDIVPRKRGRLGRSRSSPCPALTLELFAVPGKVPLWLEEGEVATDEIGEGTVVRRGRRRRARGLSMRRPAPMLRTSSTRASPARMCCFSTAPCLPTTR